MTDNEKLAAILRGREGRQAAQALRQAASQPTAVPQGPVSPRPTPAVRQEQPYAGWQRGRVLGEKKAVRQPPAKQAAAPAAQPQQQAARDAAQKAQQMRSQQTPAQAQARQRGREPGR